MIAQLTYHLRTTELQQAQSEWEELRQGPRLDLVDAYRLVDEYRKILLTVDARDAGHITKPELHKHLWIGTKQLTEDYVAACVRGLRTMRKCGADGYRMDKKIEWFQGRRMVLGHTALFLQGGKDSEDL